MIPTSAFPKIELALLKEIDNIKKKTWEEFRKTKIIGEAGGGLVKVTVLGDGLFVKCNIDAVTLATRDIKFVETLVTSATNDAIKRAVNSRNNMERKMAAKIGDMTKDALIKAVSESQDSFLTDLAKNTEGDLN